MEQQPLGEQPYSIKISRAELKIAYEHRVQTGEPIQSWVRRLIREGWEDHLRTILSSTSSLENAVQFERLMDRSGIQKPPQVEASGRSPKEENS